ncbi:MAG: hypothetical protein ACK4SY_07660 [Pyrobaculum sp.]
MREVLEEIRENIVSVLSTLRKSDGIYADVVATVINKLFETAYISGERMYLKVAADLLKAYDALPVAYVHKSKLCKVEELCKHAARLEVTIWAT